jgi:hypothetical protein
VGKEVGATGRSCFLDMVSASLIVVVQAFASIGAMLNWISRLPYTLAAALFAFQRDVLLGCHGREIPCDYKMF